VTQESDQNSINFVVLENVNLIKLDTAEPSWSPAKINLFYAYLTLTDKAAGAELPSCEANAPSSSQRSTRILLSINL
jgi:hypothetical protein